MPASPEVFPDDSGFSGGVSADDEDPPEEFSVLDDVSCLLEDSSFLDEDSSFLDEDSSFLLEDAVPSPSLVALGSAGRSV